MIMASQCSPFRASFVFRFVAGDLSHALALRSVSAVLHYDAQAPTIPAEPAPMPDLTIYGVAAGIVVFALCMAAIGDFP